MTTRIAAAFAAAILGVGLALGSATAASAHDTLVDADPRPDTVAQTAPEQLTLTFSGELQELGHLVVVIDTEGTDWVSGPATTAGNTLTQPLEGGMPDGSYQVRWQVVGSDGHSISGFYDFAVGEASPGGIPAPGAAGEHDHADEVTTQAPAGDSTGLFVGIAAAVAVALAVVVVVVAARRRSRR